MALLKIHNSQIIILWYSNYNLNVKILRLFYRLLLKTDWLEINQPVGNTHLINSCFCTAIATGLFRKSG